MDFVGQWNHEMKVDCELKKKLVWNSACVLLILNVGHDNKNQTSEPVKNILVDLKIKQSRKNYY